MSRTIRNKSYEFGDVEVRPGKPWQENRGKRYGNNRKMYARMKCVRRREERAEKNRNVEQYFE